jgi:hypothetical protein
MNWRQGRRPDGPIESLSIGTIIEVCGTHIVADIDMETSELSRVYEGIVYPIGEYGSVVKVHHGRRTIYGYVTRLALKTQYELEKGIMTPPSASNEHVIEADFFGEGEWTKTGNDDLDWKLRFARGVSNYPLPMQRLYLTPRDELASVYGGKGANGIRIGEHVGSGGAPCYADLNELLNKHVAILGSTGSGKSAAVAMLLLAITHRGEDCKFSEWNPRIIVLDPHNEYRHAFPESRSLSTDAGTLRLPYWLLNYSETVDFFIGHTEHAATVQTAALKVAMLAARQAGARMLGLDPSRITVDSPVPYELGDVAGLADNVVGQQSAGTLAAELFKTVPSHSPSSAEKDAPSKIARNIVGKQADSRYGFMMTPLSGQSSADPLPEILGQLGDGEGGVCIVDLSGVPNEVAGITAAVIARLVFQYRLWQTPEERTHDPLLLICEEAHRYVPDNTDAQYADAREAIQRLAKEGRKYGIGLCLVSQRPSELDPTVLSQCGTWIVLRLTNDADCARVRAILPDSLTGLSSMLSDLRQREALFVGLAAALPSRIVITELNTDQLPRSQDIDFDQGWQMPNESEATTSQVALRWRYQDRRASIDVIRELAETPKPSASIPGESEGAAEQPATLLPVTAGESDCIAEKVNRERA